MTVFLKLFIIAPITGLSLGLMIVTAIMQVV